MSTKVKTQRLFTFKAYNVKEGETFQNDVHSGKFLSKSDCHYYCEKEVLDFVKNNISDVKKGEKFLIYKISTIEDSNVKDMLIEQIYVEDGKIVII